MEHTLRHQRDSLLKRLKKQRTKSKQLNVDSKKKDQEIKRLKDVREEETDEILSNNLLI